MYQPFAHLTPRGKPYDLPPLPNTLKRGRKMEKLTYEHIKSVIKTADYLQHGQLTVCVLTLQNGFTVTGESAGLSLATYDTEVSKKVAFDNAVDKVLMLESYLAKQRMFEATQGK
jgi:hypothetical protein